MVERLRLPPPKPRQRNRRYKQDRPGRPPGSTNSMSMAQREEAAKTGELPHQFMLRVMRLGPGKYIGRHKITWEDVKWAAKAAAPYFAARLASVQLKAVDRPPVVIQMDPKKLIGLKPAAISQLLAAMLAANAPTTINGEVVGNGSDQDVIDAADVALYEQTLN